MLLADTVGFVRRLPHRLVEAFKSTLEEVRDADLMLHLVNAADPDPEGQIEAVREVLTEIGADGAATITVINKIDIAQPAVVKRLLGRSERAVAVSALTGEGAAGLIEALVEWLNSRLSTVHLLIPYARGDVVASLHRCGDVMRSMPAPDGLKMAVRLPPDQVDHFRAFADYPSDSG